MMRKRVVALFCGIALVAMLGGNAPASAAPESQPDNVSGPGTYAAQASDAGLNAHEARQVQQKVDDELSTMAVDAHQVGFNEIATDDGLAKITLSTPRDSIPVGCHSGYLCLYAGDNWDHKTIVFYRCATAVLHDFNFANRLTSYNNYQSDGTRSKFYTYDNDGYTHYQFDSHAPHSESDLARHGRGWNNTIDKVKIC